MHGRKLKSAAKYKGLFAMTGLKINKIIFSGLLLYLFVVRVSAQQINIPRIEQMPNLPAPYEMRDWKQIQLIILITLALDFIR